MHIDIHQTAAAYAADERLSLPDHFTFGHAVNCRVSRFAMAARAAAIDSA